MHPRCLLIRHRSQLSCLLSIALAFHSLGCLAEVGNRIENQHVSRRSIDENHGYSAVKAGYLLAEPTDQRLNLNDPIDRNLSEILDRHGPDLRPSRDSHDFTDITLDISIRAWDLLHEHAVVATEQKVDSAWPIFERLLAEAKTSSVCISSIKETMAGASP
jgi:hypothetical protein